MMPRNLILFFFTFTCIGQILHAEVIPWVRVAYGTTNPQGEFSGTNFERKNNGFAKTDVGFKALFGLKLNEALSLTFEYATLNNGLNADKVAESINTLYSKSFYYSDEGVNYTTSFGSAGIMMHKSLAKNQMEVYLGSRLGFSRCEKPNFSLFMDDYVAHVRYIYTQDAGSSSALAYAVDAGIEFKPHPLIQIGVNIGYYNATHEFSYQASNANGIIDVKYRVPVVNLFTGISVRLNLVSLE